MSEMNSKKAYNEKLFLATLFAFSLLVISFLYFSTTFFEDDIFMMVTSPEPTSNSGSGQSFSTNSLRQTTRHSFSGFVVRDSSGSIVYSSPYEDVLEIFFEIIKKEVKISRNLLASVSIRNLDNELVNAEMQYKIYNSSNREVYSFSKSIEINKTFSNVYNFNNFDASAGRYAIDLIVSYNNLTKIISQDFLVIEEQGSTLSFSTLGSVMVIIFGVMLFLWVRAKNQKDRIEYQ